jgi:hypothetical protein
MLTCRIHVLTLCLLAGAVATAAPAPRKYRLKETAAAGDRSTVEDRLQMSVTMRVQLPDRDGVTLIAQEPPDLRFSTREFTKYTEAVLAIDKEGPTSVRRVYSAKRSVETDPGGNEEVKVSSLQGKTITIRRSGQKISVTPAAGRVAEEDRKELSEELDSPDVDFFPRHPVAPGDDWTVDPKAAATLFKGAERASMTGKFVEVVSYRGLRCARIGIHVEAAGSFGEEKEPMAMVMTLQGSIHHALEINRTVSIDMAGPVTVSSRLEEGGTSLKLSGEGTMRATLLHHWEKVGGQVVRRQPAAR